MSSVQGLLPAGYIFERAELRAMGDAFDNALAMSPAGDRDSIAAIIFRMAQRGERDSKMLCDAALRTSATPEEIRFLRRL